jgi:uncharacterized protein (DUF2336 family)|tara:strand:+ start:240572 stop:241816 length:1245 start_codon:yes stop_codon:yes gene_type:complete
MDFSLLEKSENLGHLMVKLHDVYNEYKQDIFGTVFSQNRISDVVEEILTEDNITEQEQELVTEILLALIKDAEEKLKAAISDRISVIDDAPNKLARALANDEITVARPILENSVSLNDDDLVYLINTKEQDHWRSIARRRSLDDAIINKLSETSDSHTYNELLKNFNIRLTQYSGKKIAERAKKEHFLANSLIGRDELSQSIIIDIYQHVGEALQQAIQKKYNYTSEELNKAISEISSEISSGEAMSTKPMDAYESGYVGDGGTESDESLRVISHKDAFLETELMSKNDEEYKVALRYKQNGELTIDLMTRHLRRKQFRSFIAQLAVMSKLDPGLVKDILRQPYGKGLAIICIALDVSKKDYMNFYLLSQPLRGSSRIVSDGNISKAMAAYSRTDPRQAQKVMENNFNSGEHIR